MSEINKIYNLDESDSKLLFSNNYNGMNIEVRQHEQLRWLQMDGDLIQSVVDLNNPECILNPVTRNMCLSLIFPESCLNVLNLGLGGASFERLFSNKLPEMEIDSVETNEIVIHLAREFFFLPVNHPVFQSSADKFLDSNRQQYNVVLCDIFEQEQLPECLYSERFYENAANNLSDDGVLALNLTPENESEMLELLLPMRKHFPDIRLTEITDHQNTIVFAIKQNFADKKRLHDRCLLLGEKLGINLKGMFESLNCLPKK